jgi:hypothetical protein
LGFAIELGWRIFGVMGNEYAGGFYVVAASKDGYTEYWVASTPADIAVASVLRALPYGWTAKITTRHLTTAQIAALKMRPNSVRRLESE